MSRIKGFIEETIVYGFANVFSRIFAMILIPFYATYLGKIDYSNLVMIQSFFTILTFFLVLNTGIFYYYYINENVKYRKILFTSWFYYEFALSLFFIVVLYFSSDWLSQFLIVNSTNYFEITTCLILVGVQLIPYSFNNTNINLCRIDRKPKKVMIIIFFESLLTLILVYIALYVLKYGLIGVVVGQIVARLLIALSFTKMAMFYCNLKYFSFRLLKKVFTYTWPYFIISIFSWLIISMDKFIGAQALANKADVAILALAMQLVIPIAILAGMIRMAIGPFAMSIHKESDADKTYQQVFDLTIFTASIVVVIIIGLTPLLTLLLTNESFLSVIYVVPLMAMASVFSLAANQFSISFNLVKKNTIILFATVISGIIGVLINYLFMERWGYIVSGISQIISYLVMGGILYWLGRKIAKLTIQLKNSTIIILITGLFVSAIYCDSHHVLEGNYMFFYTLCLCALFVITFVYFRINNLNLKSMLKKLFNN